MNRMPIACTPPKLGSQWGLRYLSLQTTGQHCLSVELIAHPDDLRNTALLHKKSVFPLHSLTRKDKQRGTRMCTLYFQERPGNIYHHRITITIVTAIDGVEVTKLTQLCQFILWFSLILLTLKCTSIYLSQYRNSSDIISSDNPL